MFILHNMKIFLACFLVIWGGQTIAMAKPLMREAAGIITLCTSHGIEQVIVDANGVPIDDTPICPDCLTSYVSIGTVADFLSAPVIMMSAVDYAISADQGTVRVHPIPFARGPPAAL